MQVEHVDFVSFLTQDLARAKRFYTEVIGLEVETEGEHDLELRAGQVTLDIFDPSSIGQPFAPSPAGLALRVPDVDATRAELEATALAERNKAASLAMRAHELRTALEPT